jgi:hypothetical protein
LHNPTPGVHGGGERAVIELIRARRRQSKIEFLDAGVEAFAFTFG